MSAERRRFRVEGLLAEGILQINDGYRAKNDELSSAGLPFARAGNINNGFNFAGVDRFPLEQLSKVSEKVSKSGDVVLTSKGTVGRIALVRSDTPRFVYSPQLCFWRILNEQFIEPRYLYYWMVGPEFSSQLNAVKGQTDMADYVSLRDQRCMLISLPGLQEQRSIAEMLEVLDDKIDINRRMNQTLETMARAIFKSWFVDFDPFQGQMPEEWAVSTVGEMVGVVGGSTPSTAEPRFWGGQYHFATPKDMAALPMPILSTTERTITSEGLTRISSGLLPPGTVLLSSRAPIGYLAISEIPVAVNQGFIAMVCDDRLPNYYVLEWARHNMDVIVGNANGTTFLEISKRNFRPIPVLVPARPVLRRFVGLVEPLYRRIVSNLQEAETLATLRDTLLPKLLSGEIRVKQAEKIVGEAV